MGPRPVERAGTPEEGSIAGLYTVLVEGDDMNEPIADAARGLLDGHVVLSRRLASEGHFPAIDVLASVSRLMSEIVSPAEIARANQIRSWLATYRDAEDLINIGAYRTATNPLIDEAIARRPLIEAFLRQGLHEKCSLESSFQAMTAVTA